MSTAQIGHNVQVNNIIQGYASTNTSTSTLVMTSASKGLQYITGSTASFVATLPSTNVLQGTSYTFVNTSTQTITIQIPGPVALTTIPTLFMCTVICNTSTPTTTTHWNYNTVAYNSVISSGGSVTLTDVTTGTFYPVLSTTSGTSTLSIAQSIPIFSINTLSTGAIGVGSDRIAIGTVALAASASAVGGVALGASAAAASADNSRPSVAIGRSAGGNGTAAVAIGAFATASGSGGSIAIGGSDSTSGSAIASASYCIAIGGSTGGGGDFGAEAAAASAIAIGHKAYAKGVATISMGDQTSHPNNTGANNIFIGLGAGLFTASTAGGNNIGIGASSLGHATTPANSNVGIGNNAANFIGGNVGIVAIGHQALGGAVASGANNTAIGYQSQNGSNATGASNTSLGYQTLNVNSSGANNVAVGALAGIANTTGTYNTMLGSNAGPTTTTGSFNIFVGGESYSDATASNVVAIGAPVTGIPLASGWTARSTTGVDFYFTSICYSSKLDLYVAVATITSFISPPINQQVVRSSNGTTWVNTSLSGVAADYWNKVIWAESIDVFLAICSGPTASNRVMHSADGIAWTAISIGGTPDRTWASIAWSTSQSLGLIVASNSTSTYSFSPTGTSGWNTTNAATAMGALNDIVWCPGLRLYCAVGGGGAIATTIDQNTGNWIQRVPPVGSLTPTSSSCTGTTATHTFGSAPNLVTGQIVWIQGFAVPQYNGVFTITVSGSTITCTVPTANLPAASGATGGFVFGSTPPANENVIVSAHNWVSVCWSPQLKLIAAVSATGTDTTHQIATSPDGIDWTYQLTPENNPWTSICWNSSSLMFIAVASSGTNRVMYSTDGVTWSVRAAATANLWGSVTDGRGLIVAVAASGTENRVMTATTTTNIIPTQTTTSSSMAIGSGAVSSGNNSMVIGTGSGLQPSYDFRTRPIPTGDSNNQYLRSVWSPELNLFVTVAVNGVSGQRVATSPDGITWTLRATPANLSWYDVAWSPTLGLFVAVAGGGGTPTTMRSSDGSTWTQASVTGITTDSIYAVTWSPELKIFVTVGNNVCYTSRDGIAWVSRSIGSGIWSDVCWSPDIGIFVAVRPSSAQVVTSANGIDWVARTTPVSGDWFQISWSPKLHMFVSANFASTTNQIMTSTNGITWYIQKTPGTGTGFLRPVWIPELSLWIIAGRTGARRILISSDGINWLDYEYPSDELDGYGTAWSPALKRVIFNHNAGKGFGYMDAIVTSSKAVGAQSIAIGNGAQTLAQGSTAIGNNIIADKTDGLFMRHRVVGPEEINPCGFRPGTNELVEWIPYYCNLVAANGGNPPIEADLPFAIVSDPYNMSVTGAPPLNFSGARGIRIPVSGIYSVASHYVLIPQSGTWTAWGLKVVKNNAITNIYHHIILSVSVSNQAAFISTTDYFNTGDIITIRCVTSATGLFATDTGSFRIARLR